MPREEVGEGGRVTRGRGVELKRAIRSRLFLFGRDDARERSRAECGVGGFNIVVNRLRQMKKLPRGFVPKPPMKAAIPCNRVVVPPLALLTRGKRAVPRLAHRNGGNAVCAGCRGSVVRDTAANAAYFSCALELIVSIPTHEGRVVIGRVDAVADLVPKAVRHLENIARACVAGFGEFDVVLPPT